MSDPQNTAAPAPPAAEVPAAAPTGDEELNADGTPLSDKQKRKRAEKAEKERKKAETAARLAAEKAAREAAEVDFATQYYGVLPLNQSQERTGRKRTKISEINAARDGEEVFFQARVQTSRSPSAKLVFITLRQTFDCIQATLAQAPEKVSKQMVKWTAGLSPETIVLVQGTITKVPKPIESAAISVKDAEIKISQIHVLSEVKVDGQLPFYVDDATRSEQEIEASQSTERPLPSIALETRLDNRVLELRTTTNQAIFRIQHGVCRLFREFLDNLDFIEIHSPKLQGAATESGASVFKVDYFKGAAFLAQSPQLAKQMCVSADYGRVYEIGPVFRAEDSNTHRHMTEFTGLDLEMAFDEHYHEVVDVLADLFTFIFTELPKRYRREIDVIKKQFPVEDFLIPEKPVKLDYKEGIALLREAGVEIGDYDDINTEQERKLGGIIREKYKTDFYMLDKFPTEIRPFYTMPDPKEPKYSNSYDFFMRGQEILSGAQRIHDPTFLETRMKEMGVAPESMKGYVDAFRLGAPPHAGGGIGLERVVMFYLGLGNIRRACMFPRDPKRLEP
ncbi:aspartate--tRNA ligase dps1 [Tilletia horrida]|uniref:Aspartate--tRNA ligase, cytoplasmic n=1 Tax=Tilletia horrida TaxID=155126 RepID=A0AAN6GIY7_9BASI|nr:aspartate--tRNA ligase dps1 [Tilletia horrida]KAK0536733.1 aspartate--tRNA ligase dps1 [Tilletia horrida]KAK0539669.1 aspartate--tRNA ligase dps1 [Tilletia horrida]KAK0564196.1 aspartate--tRNA ligase dps1 [Tilletia horrida]